MINIPNSLVQGTNTPHGINVLSDFIQEITGFPPEFHESGWTTGYEYNNNTINEYAHNTNDLTTSTKRFFYDNNGGGGGSGQISYEDDPFSGHFYGYDNGNGNGHGYGYLNGNGDGCVPKYPYIEMAPENNVTITIKNSTP